MVKQTIALAVISLATAQALYAGKATMDNVKLFDNFFQDASQERGAYAQGNVYYISDDAYDAFGLNMSGGAVVAPRIEVGISLGFASVDFDHDASESGLRDPIIGVKYHLDNWENNQISVGAHLSLPVGDEDVGGDKTDFGVFGAIRHPLNNRTVITGMAGLSSIEVNDGWDDDREFSLQLGGGLIYKVDEMLHGIAELTMATEVDEMDLTVGADYAVHDNGSLRGSIDLGLDDGSADFTLQVGYLYRF